MTEGFSVGVVHPRTSTDRRPEGHRPAGPGACRVVGRGRRGRRSPRVVASAPRERNPGKGGNPPDPGLRFGDQSKGPHVPVRRRPDARTLGPSGSMECGSIRSVATRCSSMPSASRRSVRPIHTPAESGAPDHRGQSTSTTSDSAGQLPGRSGAPFVSQSRQQERGPNQGLLDHTPGPPPDARLHHGTARADPAGARNSCAPSTVAARPVGGPRRRRLPGSRTRRGATHRKPQSDKSLRTF